MTRSLNFVITMETVGRSEQPLPIPQPRSALDGPAGEVRCGCPCETHESSGLAQVCQHSAEQLVTFTIRLSGSLAWVGTARWSTCPPCAQAIRAVLKRRYEQRRRQLSGETPDGGEHRG